MFIQCEMLTVSLNYKLNVVVGQQKLKPWIHVTSFSRDNFSSGHYLVQYFCIKLSTVIYFSDNEDEINATAAKSLEVEGVRAAESGDLDTAIGLFTRAINIAPKWASGYNNRAQAYRLKGDTAGMRVFWGLPPSCDTVCQSKISVHPVHKKVFSTTVLRLALGPPTFLFYQHVVFFMCILGGGLSSWGVNWQRSSTWLWRLWVSGAIPLLLYAFLVYTATILSVNFLYTADTVLKRHCHDTCVGLSASQK